MNPTPARGLSPLTALRITLIIVAIAAVPIVYFLHQAQNIAGSTLAPASTQTENAAAPPSDVMAALTALKQRVATNPRDADALAALAGMYTEAGKPEQAERYDAQAIAVRPNDPTLRMADAQRLGDLHKYTAARKQVDVVLAATPRNVDARYLRVGFDANLHDKGAVKSDLRTFLRDAPANDPRRSAIEATLKAQ